MLCLGGRALTGHEGTVDKHIAVVVVGVANPHERPDGLDLAVVEESWTDAEDRIAIPDDPAICEVDGAAEVESVARALMFIWLTIFFEPKISRPSACPVVVVTHREVDELNAGGVIGGEGTAARGSGHGWIEGAVIAVAHLNVVTILTAEGDIGLVAKEDDLLVCAVFDEDGDTMRRVGGDEVNSALDGVEVAAAIGCYDDAGSIRGGRGGFGGEGPGSVACESRRRAPLAGVKTSWSIRTTYLR
jgi:hypothetical protein